jgi:hypothetical protein
MDEDTKPEIQTEEPPPVPMIQCHGEGYITRADGTVVPFTLSTEEQ